MSCSILETHPKEPIRLNRSSSAAFGPKRTLTHAAHVAGRLVVCLLCAAVLAMLASCGGSGGSGGSAGGAAGGNGGQTRSVAPSGERVSGAAYTQPATVIVPPATAGGIDTSGVDEGWVCASATSAARLKFQVTCNDVTYNYDLPNDGTPTLFPINMGSGAYRFRVMQNTEGKNYVELDSVRADVALASDVAPFLIPNQLCYYDEDSACVAKARELTAASANQGEAVAAICTYVVDNTTYDTAKAKELATATGYIPDPDDTFASGTGICFDYASLATAMLRSMGLPTKLITGYVGAEQLYHAWIMVFVDGTWQTAAFSVSPNTWSRCDVTFASTGATQYVGKGDGYTDRYTY